MYEENRGKKLFHVSESESYGVWVVSRSLPAAIHVRLEVVVVLAVGHLDEGVREVSLAGLLFHEPDFVEALPADAPAKVSVKLWTGTIRLSASKLRNEVEVDAENSGLPDMFPQGSFLSL